MAKLPTRESLGGLPSTRGGNIASISPASLGRGAQVGAIGAGLVNIGKGLDVAAKAAMTIEAQDRKREEFETERKFQEFDWNQRLALDQSMRSIEPGQARDFPEIATQNYTKSAQEFYASVPDHLKAQYDGKLFATERNLYGAATTFARKEQKRFAVESIDGTIENVYRPKARTTQTDELDSVTSDYDRLVDANPDLTPIEKDEIKRNGRKAIALSHLDSLPPEQAKTLLKARPMDATPEGLLRKFEGFKSGAYWDVNAYRAGYGSDTVTRADGTIEKVTKDTVVTREDAERDLARRSVEFAQRAEGQVGAEVWNSMPPNVRAGLTSVAYNYGKLPDSVVRAVGTGNVEAIAGSVQSLSANKSRRAQEAAVIMGSGGVPTAFTALTDDDRMRMDSVLTTRQAKAAVERAEVFERLIIDASAGRGPLPDRAVIEIDAGLDDQRRNTLLRQHDAAAGNVMALQGFMNKLQTGGAFNPYDANEKKLADAAFVNLGGDNAALQIITQKTGIIPKSAAVAMRGDVNSNDPGRVVSAMTLASNIMAKSPNIFDAAEGGNDIEKNAVSFRHYVDDLGMTAEEAAKKIINKRSPEYKASVNAKIKGEDINEIIKKKVTISDLAGKFDDIPWIPFTDPAVGFTPRQRDLMFDQYAELVKENYMETGDLDEAKKVSAQMLKKTWGVSRASGSPVVMPYPPERAPGNAGIENVSELIARDALTAIKSDVGIDVDRKDIRLTPIPGVTAQAYKAGAPVPYMLSWKDKDGNIQMVNPGRGFVFDAKAARAAITEGRAQQFMLRSMSRDAQAGVLESSVMGAP